MSLLRKLLLTPYLGWICIMVELGEVPSGRRIPHANIDLPNLIKMSQKGLKRQGGNRSEGKCMLRSSGQREF